MNQMQKDGETLQELDAICDELSNNESRCLQPFVVQSFVTATADSEIKQATALAAGKEALAYALHVEDAKILSQNSKKLRGVSSETSGKGPLKCQYGQKGHTQKFCKNSGKKAGKEMQKHSYLSKDMVTDALENIHEAAREELELNSERMKTFYDTTSSGPDLNEGDQMLLYNPKRKKGVCPKLTKKWEGPFTIIKKLMI
uniref:Uncharacterized protein n=1 Tax=Megaselia scalaris TaxID=36166 RepID=T1GCM8_MEGSC